MSRCLHHNPLGGIAQCPEGCCLHLYFGNVGLRLLPHELRQWRSIVAELCTYHAPHIIDAEARSLSIPGPSADVIFLFSLEELHWLHDLLLSAALLLEADALLAPKAGS